MRDKTKDTLHRNRELMRKMGLLGNDLKQEDDGTLYDPLVELANSDSLLEIAESKLHDCAEVGVGLELAMSETNNEAELAILADLHQLTTTTLETCIENYRKAYAKVDPDSHLYIEDLIQEILHEAEEDAIEEHKKFKPKNPPLSNE